MRITLTERQRDAIADVLNERLAGGVDDLRDALGISNKEAKAMWIILERVQKKLYLGDGPHEVR